MVKPPTMQQGSSDDFQTPDYALDILIPWLKKEWIIWECGAGKGNIVRYLEKQGFTVKGSDILTGVDFLTSKMEPFDCIVTNPPFSLKDDFIKRCYDLGKPFALLLPLTALEGKDRQSLYKKYGIQLIVPDSRINFYTPDGKNSGSWFLSAWYTWKMNLPHDINFVDMTKRTKVENYKVVEKANLGDWIIQIIDNRYI